MNMKFTFKSLLALAFVAVSAGSLTSCKDYEGDDTNNIIISNYQAVKGLQDQMKELQDQVNFLASSIACKCDGLKITDNGNKTFTLTDKNGNSFSVPSTALIPSSTGGAKKDANGYYVEGPDGEKVYIPYMKQDGGKTFIVWNGQEYEIPAASEGCSCPSITIAGDKITVDAGNGKKWEFDKSTIPAECSCKMTLTYDPVKKTYTISDGTNPGVEIPTSTSGTCTCDFSTMIVDNGNGTVTITNPKDATKTATIKKNPADVSTYKNGNNEDVIKIVTYKADGTVDKTEEVVIPKAGTSCSCTPGTGCSCGSMTSCTCQGGGTGCSCDLSTYAKAEDLTKLLKELYGEGGTATNPQDGSLADRVKKLETTVGDENGGLVKDVNDLQGDVEDLQDDVEDLMDSIADHRTQIDQNTSDIKDVKAEIEDIMKELYGENGTKEDPKEGSVIYRLNEIEKTIKEILDKVNDLLDARAKLITSIEIEQVSNELFGSYTSLLTNVQTNLLFGYYGVASGAVDFPTASNAIYSFDAGDQIPSEEAKMGKIYLTINPLDEDFDKLNAVDGGMLSIVNTQSQASALQLGTVTASDKVLTFGVSRAASNGFYEVPVTLPKGDYASDKFHVAIDKSAIKSAIKNLKAKNPKATLSDLATAAMTTAKSLNNIERLGIKVTWEDSLGVHSVSSKHDIGAVAVKPLGFDVFDGFDNLPGYTKLVKAINKVKTKIDEKVIARINARLAKYSDKMAQRGIIKIEAVNEDSYDVTINYTSDSKGETHLEQTIKDINQEYINAGEEPIIISVDTEKMQMVVRYDVKDFEDFVDGIAINDIANLTDMINDLLEEANGKIDKYEEKIYNKLMSLLEKINEKGTKAMHKVAHPALVVNSANGMTFASVEGAVPVVVSGNVTLIPTTYSAGVIAPTFARYIEINGVGQLVEENTVDVTSQLQTGLNKIVYYALDYTGRKEVYTYVIEKK
ncbi:MAG: hypothetical protein KBT34_02365 [Prevotella sp.]|nr:hypothetical protein [Candidatus Prevotella equi]